MMSQLLIRSDRFQDPKDIRPSFSVYIIFQIYRIILKKDTRICKNFELLHTKSVPVYVRASYIHKCKRMKIERERKKKRKNIHVNFRARQAPEFLEPQARYPRVLNGIGTYLPHMLK